jgi:hypothetical protein
MTERNWRDEPLLPEQTEDDVVIGEADDDRDDELRRDVPPHHGSD